MRLLNELIFVTALGALLYSVIEIVWRGRSHWSMTVTGGVCFFALYCVNAMLPAVPLALKCLIGTAVVTAVEFAVGCFVNLRMKWNVWDYSNQPLNIKGQVCALYAVYWYFLGFPAFLLSAFIKSALFPF